MIKHNKLGILLLAAVFSFMAVMLEVRAAESPATIKKRMQSRLAAIEALKTKGIVGENNKGFLNYRKKSNEGKTIVDAENADRAKIYKMIAGKTRVSEKIVGQQRAKKIAQSSKSGQWIQKQNGQWTKK